MLSFSTANSDYKLSDKTKKYTQEYALAEKNIQNTISDVDDILAQERPKTTDHNVLLSNVNTALANNEKVRVEGQNVIIDEQINYGQLLEFKLEILPPNQEARYKIISVKSVDDINKEEAILE